MRAFARPGFRLATASLEIRVTYAAFLLLLFPGIATLIGLSAARVGITPAAISAYYRGGAAEEMSFPKPLWQLVETAHFHLFAIPVVILILTHLLFAAGVWRRSHLPITLACWVGAALDVFSPLAIRYLAASFAWALLSGWLLLGTGMTAAALLSFVGLWRQAPVAAP